MKPMPISPPPPISMAYDVLFTLGGTLNRSRIEAILANYNSANYPGEYPTQIRKIEYDGSLRLGAWVNCDRGDGEFDWLYIAAGDDVNRQMIALAASAIK